MRYTRSATVTGRSKSTQFTNEIEMKDKNINFEQRFPSRKYYRFFGTNFPFEHRKFHSAKTAHILSGAMDGKRFGTEKVVRILI